MLVVRRQPCACNLASVVKRSQLHQPTQPPNLPPYRPEASIHLIHAIQNAAKFNETNTTRVHTFLAVVRIPRVSTDLLVSVHRPVDADTREVENEQSLSEFCIFINTLRINDYSLFQ
ncbi:hypothetical protein BC830DRAFT_1088476 [Chytriomyces sp. MP71]|nr:hypothetical protein BC830DRAFT_1097829 [Chytriomyces sp. MP71]KAI8622710.1 hypothetical protein BC830DRAFT_1088476 [Chytriomyces sp. MP71]